MKQREKKPAASKLILLLPLLFLAGCSHAVLFHPKGEVAGHESTLIAIAAGVMLLVVIPAIAMAIIFAVKYRATNGKARYEPRWASSKKIEAVVWGVPTLIILVLATLSWITTHSLDPSEPLSTARDSITIQVVSMDWKWLFIYPDQNVASVNEVAFPANTEVNFQLTSDTVMTSFFIPQLGSQIYTMAGMRTELHLNAEEPGTYDGMAANFSGPGFSRMTFKAVATSRSGFEKWIKDARSSGNTLDPASYQELAKPSEGNPVRYFASVRPNLFSMILNKYTARQTPGPSGE